MPSTTSPRPHSPTLSTSSLSSSSSSSFAGSRDERSPRENSHHSSSTTTTLNGNKKGKERAVNDINNQHTSSCCQYEAAVNSPLLSPGHSHLHLSRPNPAAAAAASTPSTTYPTPWSIESIIHLTRRAARQLTFTATSPSSSGGGVSLSDSGYLPLYSPANAIAKQRLSSEVYLAEKDDGFLSDASSSNNNEKCICKQRRINHQQQHYHPPPQSLRSSCCLSSSPSSPTSPLGNNHTAGRFFSIHHFIALVKLAILALALLGIATIVGLATGLMQRTPIYTEKALQEAGWARRPITLSSSSSSSSSNTHSQQQSFIKDPYTGVTLHDFSPASPLYALPGTSPASSSKSSFSPSSSSSSSNQPNSLTISAPVTSDSLHLLILCPLRNSAPDLPHLFELLDSLTHPKMNTSLGFLIGDEDDDTGDVLHRLVQDRTSRDADNNNKRYRHISMLHKDFNLAVPNGANRHSYPVQLQRRSVMARARTYLLTATLEPSVDWVLWIDSDIAEMSPTLFQDLLLYGNAGVLGPSSPQAVETVTHQQQQQEWNDVIVPNAMRRLADGNLLGFDMNNWSETPESRKLKADMPSDHLLIEGNIWQHMHRVHLADQYVPYTTAEALSSSSSSSSSSASLVQEDATSSASDGVAVRFKNQPEIFSSDPRYIASLPPSDQRLNTSAPAYIGRLEPLDGIGGVAALVRAEVHRMGAIFPSWIFENQLETEAFGVLAKRLGARVVGLPNLFVLHP